MIELKDLEAAQQIISGRVHRTQVTGSTYLGEQIGARLLFKLEMFQKTGSFKLRGVLNRMHHLTHEARKKGVISVSAGNHAQALAYAASLWGVPSTVVMPSSALKSKVEATKAYGAEVKH